MSAIEGKAVLLTGASGEIGAEVARRLAKRGARLAISARRKDRLEALAAEIAATGAAGPFVLEADLGRRGEAAALGRRAIEELDGVDVLINNAGGSMQGLTWVSGDREEGRTVFETNLWSPLALAAAVVPGMLETGGAIVNVGSMARVSPYPHLGVYAASRAALSLASQVQGLELAPRGVRVVEVALGPVDTPASRENRVLAGADRWLEGRPGLGRASYAAAAIASAAEDPSANGVVHYPRVLRWPERLPGLGRRYARRMAKGADLDDESVRLGGSSGDPVLLGLRGNSS